MTNTLVSTREVPWMKLGKLANEPMTAKEAANAGGLNFAVAKCDLHFTTWTAPNAVSGLSQQVTKQIVDRKAIVRVDTGECLGIMSKDYPLLQYAEAFDFMDTVNTRYVACGALKSGRQGFMVVQLPELAESIMKTVDPHDMYAVLRTSHDGSRAVEVLAMPLRQRCMNQLTLASFSAGVPHRWSIKHTSTMHEKLAEAQKSLGNLTKYAERFAQTADRLMSIKLTDKVAQTTLEQVLPDRPKRADQIERILTSWHTAETVGFDFTGWGLVNAVSEYFDWGRSGGSPESRFIGALQGSTTNTINRVAGRLLSRV